MPIELLFYGVDGIEDNFRDVIQAGGGTIIEFKGNKMAFAEQTVPSLAKQDFNNFIPLFKAIKAIQNANLNLCL